MYTTIPAEEYAFPHVNVYRKCRDGEQYAWQLLPEDGYVLYNTAERAEEYDCETAKPRPVTYYYTIASLPMRYDMGAFSWAAVPRSEVEKTYIFG